MQNISRPLVIGGAIALLFAAVILSGIASSSPWMVFFLLSAMLLAITISSAFGDEAGGSGGTGHGSTAGVLDINGNSGSSAASARGGEGAGAEPSQRLPDPLEDGFDLPL